VCVFVCTQTRLCVHVRVGMGSVDQGSPARPLRQLLHRFVLHLDAHRAQGKRMAAARSSAWVSWELLECKPCNLTSARRTLRSRRMHTCTHTYTCTHLHTYTHMPIQMHRTQTPQLPMCTCTRSKTNKQLNMCAHAHCCTQLAKCIHLLPPAQSPPAGTPQMR